MSPYDPQRSRHRPSPADEGPAPVDALLEPHQVAPAEPALPEGVELEVTDGAAVVHTAAADVELSATGDDVVVHTADADVEVRTDVDEVVITAGGEEIYVDTSPREPGEGPSPFAGPSVVTSSGRSRVAVAVVAALLTLLAVLVWARRRRA